MESVKVNDPDDIESSQILIHWLNRIPRLVQRHERVSGIASKENSELAALDRKTAPLQLSHFVEVCFLPAIDALLALDQLIHPEPQTLRLRFTAHYPLLRSALESASLAFWLLRPTDPREQIVRCVRARYSDIEFARGLAKTGALMIGDATGELRRASSESLVESKRQCEAHLTSLASIADCEGIEFREYKNGQPGYGAIVREATEGRDLGGVTGETTWKVISGFTHPSALRTTHYTKHLSVEERDNDVVRVFSTSSITYLLSALILTVETLSAAIERFGAMKIKPAAR